MKPYLKKLVDTLVSELTATKAAKRCILEIGPDPDFAVANHLQSLYNAKVYAISKWPMKDLAAASSGVNVLQEDASNMPFKDALFDVVVGFSLLEHVEDVAALSREIARVLRNNGTAFLTGGPLWTCSVGHHVWVSIEGRHYRFNDDSNPLPDWGHLARTRDELREILNQKTKSVRHADAILDMIYESPLLNRLSPERIMEDLRGDFHLKPIFYKPKRIPESLHAKLGSGTDWEVQAMFLFMKKAEGLIV